MAAALSPLDAAIEEELTRLVAAEPLALPPASDKVCALYVNKIEGTYNVAHAKHDTDNAIELLYIAYNTTPVEEGGIRGQIEGIMDKLVIAQKDSQRAMVNAKAAAAESVTRLARTFPDWADVRESNDPDKPEHVGEIKEFVQADMLALCRKIQAQASAVKQDLDKIVATYTALIAETSAASISSQAALASRKEAAAAVQEEINERNARREQLEALVHDLSDDVAKYEKMARDYESRAQTAEERAFIMSIVQVGAQMVSAAIPAVVAALGAAATGGGSIVASAAANTVKRAVGDKNGDAPAPAASDKEIVDTKRAISNKQTELAGIEKSVAELKQKISALEKDIEAEKKKARATPAQAEADAPAARTGDTAGKAPASEPAAGKDGPATGGKAPSSPGAAQGGASAPGEASSGTVQGLETRVAAAKKELAEKQDEQALLVGALSGLQASLVALEKGMGKLTQEQESAATTLRAMQMKMLDKVEVYEKERRVQNAELVKINALLKGGLNKQESIQLAVQSLNLSISAQKRAREIIEEIAAFFMSFADFMNAMQRELAVDLDLFESTAGATRIRRNAFKSILSGTDRFFVSRTAEWVAVGFVCERFAECFNDGYSKLIKLRGKYLYDRELEAYLKAAATRIEDIVADRDEASKQKIVNLEAYRAQLLTGTLG